MEGTKDGSHLLSGEIFLKSALHHREAQRNTESELEEVSKKICDYEASFLILIGTLRIPFLKKSFWAIASMVFDSIPKSVQ